MIAIDNDAVIIELLNSRIFKSAKWTTRLETKGAGTNVTCEMDMSTDVVRAPIGLLLELNGKAIAVDLQFLKRAIERGEVAKR